MGHPTFHLDHFSPPAEGRERREVDRVIPHFPTLGEALAQTPAVTIRLRPRRPASRARMPAGLIPDTPDIGTLPEPLADLGVRPLLRQVSLRDQV